MESSRRKLEIGGWRLEIRAGWLASSIKLLTSSIFFLMSCSGSKNSEAEIKFQQYFVQGEQLYTKHCSNCHQPTGTGLGLVYPPLNKSDFMDAHFEEVICLMKYGREGELIVNGKSYIQPMPGVASLTDIEIAEIATYIYNSWGHEKKDITLNQVSGILKNCSPQIK